MIFSVFVTGNSAEEQWQAELLEQSWQQCGQSGELVRLVACPPEVALPLHTLARVESTPSWTEHPYIDDTYPGYEVPASLLHWLWRERLDATILLLDTGSILRQAIDQEVSPGDAIAHQWENFPVGDGPFELPASYAALQAYCVRRELNLPKVQLPLLIHSSDLLTLSARWLELIGIIRHAECAKNEPPGNAVKVAFAIAAAEYQLAPTATNLTANIIEADNGGKQFLDYCDKFEYSRTTGEYLRFLRPLRRPGVRQAQVLDQIYLEFGTPPQLKTLNVSAAAIWELSDGQRTLLQIVQELQARYELPMETLAADVVQGVKLLRFEGAINLETVT